MPGKLITLVNANEMRPLIAPIALDYIGAALQAQGFEAELLDLSLADDPEAEVRGYFRDREPLLVGYTQRNTDDCFFSGRYSCLPHGRETIALLRRHCEAPIVVGGCGFSVGAAGVLEALAGGDEVGGVFGIRGDGERALAALARAVRDGDAVEGIPGLVYRGEGGWVANPPDYVEPADLPLARRPLVDHARYLREGGQCGFETKRGCPRECVYCADPICRGPRLRLRAPASVAEELAGLIERGIDVFHTCDSEFNVPPDHALAVCEAIIKRGLGERLRWYAYCAPDGFSAELAAAMHRAGCVGINFGADHSDEGMLASLGRRHTAEDLERCVDLCRQNGIVVMYDLLLGGPGETRETLRATIEFMRRVGPDRAGASAGIRLYPGTRLTQSVLASAPNSPGVCRTSEAEAKRHGAEGLIWPTFFVAPELGAEIHQCVAELIAGDQRFFAADPGEDLTDYNYRENTTLVEAIRAGHRGAYWDILRRLQEGLPPL